MTTIRHGGPCGLRTRMRSAEREGKSANFVVPKDRMILAPGLEGGVGQNFVSRYGEAAFPYVPYSAVNRPPRFGRGRKAGTRATPPKKAGGHVTPIAVLSGIPLSGPMGSLSSSFIPAGRLGTAPQERR